MRLFILCNIISTRSAKKFSILKNLVFITGNLFSVYNIYSIVWLIARAKETTHCSLQES